MDIVSLPGGQSDIDIYADTSEQRLHQLGIELSQDYQLSPDEISQIHKVASRHPCLESNDKKCYQQDAKNGILKLRKGDELLGYIFAHSGAIHQIDYYERGSLWVNKSLSGNGFGKYLMLKMTEKLQGKNILSVTSNVVVQNVNELLMDYEIIHPEGIVKEMIEKRGAMKHDYRYFINERLMRVL